MKFILLHVVVFIGFVYSPVRADDVTIQSAQIWPDADGKHINAHCGHIIEYEGAYYWFGENRTDNRMQVNCFRSTDLKRWTFRNTVLKDLGVEKGFVERPKVIYNAKTKKFVMWMHKEGEGSYAEARAAVAVCDTVDGDYQFLGSFRPLNNMSRDDYLFRDDNGAAYFISAASNNADLKLYRLTDDYLKIDREVLTLFKGQFREAPVLFKREGTYYLLTSFCTGISPSVQYYSMSKSIEGPWSDNRLLCARRTWNTYYAQGACVFAVRGSRGTTFVYNLDRWVNPMRHIWLPLEFNSDGSIKPLEWYDEWQIDVQTGLAKFASPPAPLANNLALRKPVEATYDSPGTMRGYSHFANHEPGDAVDGDPKTYWSTNDNLPHWLKIDLERSTEVDGVELTFTNEVTNAYRIETSENGESWKTAAEGTSKQRKVMAELSKTAVRFIRVWRLGSDSGYNWPRIAEVAVLSRGENVAKGKTVTADDFQAKTDAAKAVDGNLATAWMIDHEKLPQSITVDLKVRSRVGEIRIHWESAGVAHQYFVEVSSDQSGWVRVVDQTSNNDARTQPNHVVNSPGGVRYVRVTLTGFDGMGGTRDKDMRPRPGIRELEVASDQR